MLPTATQDNDIAQLQHIARESAEGFNTGDVDRIMRFYGDTYLDVNLRNPVQSWAERRAYYSHVIQRGGFRITLCPDDIRTHGDFAFVRGTVELTLGGPPKIPPAPSFATWKLFADSPTARGR